MDKIKLESHLSHLKHKHEELDNKIKQGYNNYLADQYLSKMKQEKLLIKREIDEMETKLNTHG